MDGSLVLMLMLVEAPLAALARISSLLNRRVHGHSPITTASSQSVVASVSPFQASQKEVFLSQVFSLHL